MKSAGGISVIVYTKNEQQDLPGCLESLSWCDDIHVFDSMSTDNTVEIAKSFGATVTQRSYPNTLAFGGDESAHRNWALENIQFKHDWIFHIDADERVTPQLAVEMQQAIAGDKQAYRMERRDYFMGQWMQHVIPATSYIRLFRAGHVRYERLINPITLIDGDIGDLHGYFDHFPFSKGMHHWIGKHNQYSDAEASQIVKNRGNGVPFSLTKTLFEKDPDQRRARLKDLYYRMPLRPLVMFLFLFVAKRGFMDGKAGFRFASLRAMYEYMIVIKTQDLMENTALKK
ncbi:glycosyltransferase involved in cell wall biosynthesis [Oxalobacteraceae bacterium GrIS 2.11]